MAVLVDVGVAGWRMVEAAENLQASSTVVWDWSVYDLWAQVYSTSTHGPSAVELDKPARLVRL